MQHSRNRTETIRRRALAVMAVTAPLPAIAAGAGSVGWPVAIIPAAAGITTVAAMVCERVTPVRPMPAPVVYPERITRVDAYATPAREPEPEPDLNALRELVAAEPRPGREAA